jgi:predicted chitinase
MAIKDKSEWLVIKNNGVYPVGANGFWHGGIHIASKSGTWITPFFNGKIISGNIQSDNYRSSYNNDSDEPVELRYSTSYVLLEHNIKIPLDKELNNNQGQLELNFFTLYMHLMPYNIYSGKEISTLELPFYLEWDSIKIVNENNTLTNVKKMIIDKQYPVYNSSMIEISEPEWFYPSFNIENKKTVKIKIHTKKEDPSSFIETVLDVSYLDKRSFVKESVKLLPKVKDTTIPIYSSAMEKFTEAEKRENLLGNIKANADNCTVDYEKAKQGMYQNNLILISFLDKRFIENTPEGIVFDKTIFNENNNYIIEKKDTNLYTITPITGSHFYRCMPVEVYLGYYKNQITNQMIERKNSGRHQNGRPTPPSREQGRSNTLDENDKIEIERKIAEEERRIHNKIQLVNGVETLLVLMGQRTSLSSGSLAPVSPIEPSYSSANNITLNYFDLDKYNNHSQSSYMPDECILFLHQGVLLDGMKIHSCDFVISGYAVQPYMLRKNVVLHKGQIVKKTGDSEIPEIKKVKVYFLQNEGRNYVYADADKFKSNPLMSKVTISESGESEYGIPCYDHNGYIRNLLKKDDVFTPLYGKMENGSRIVIHNISTYSNNNERYIIYNSGIKLFGVTRLNNDICETLLQEDPEVYSLKKDTPINTLSILGLAGEFDRMSESCHFELFFTKRDIIQNLFNKKYTYYCYNITAETPLYEKILEEGETMFFSSRMAWEKTEETTGYARIKLRQLCVYFEPDSLIIADNEEPAEGSYYKIKENATSAYVYDQRIICASIRNASRMFADKNENPTAYTRYFELLKEMFFLSEIGQAYKFERLDGLKWGLILDLQPMNEKVRINKIVQDNLTFWIKKSDLSNNTKFTGDNNIYTTKTGSGAGNYVIYQGSPDNPLFKEMASHGINTRLFDFNFKQVKDRNNNIFYQFKHQSDYYYLSRNDRSGLAENMLDFNNYFEIAADADEDNEDIFCDLETIRAFSSEETDILSRYACHFPIEWDASLYKTCKKGNCAECVDAYNNKCKHLPQKLLSRGYDIDHFNMLSEIMENADVRSDVSFLRRENKVWHFHPNKLHTHLDKIIVLYVSAGQLLELGWSNVNDTMILDLNRCLALYDITTPQRIRHFISQCTHESIKGSRLVEIADGTAYEGNKVLGNTRPGDGPKFKGGGYIQLTGRGHYTDFANAMRDPRILGEGTVYVADHYPWESAGYYWKHIKRINEKVDAGANVTEVTKVVNGGDNGLEEREFYYTQCLNIFN